MKRKHYPPIPLVKVWVLIATSDNSQLQDSDRRAKENINKYFGSIAFAELYIEQAENDTEIVLV